MAYKDGTLIDLAGNRSLEVCSAMFPGKYVQGRGALAFMGDIIAPLAKRVFIMGGKRALAESMPKIKSSLDDCEIIFTTEEFAGESTQSQIDLMSQKAIKGKAELVVGVGGGKALDAAKAVANQLSVEIVVVPTLASTDAPTSTISVVYTDDGKFSHYLRFAKSPDVVVVDTEIIAKAPTRFLNAGMGGALAVSYEAEAASIARARNMIGGLPFNSVIKWASRCREIIFDCGVMASRAVDNNLVIPAVDSVVEANLLLSGIGFESGGLAAAHGVFHGFRSVIPKIKHLHGEIVAFGTLVQLILENRSEKEIGSLVGLFKALKLPYRFEHLSLVNPDIEVMKSIATYACEAGTTKNMPFAIDAKMMLHAMLYADEIGKTY